MNPVQPFWGCPYSNADVVVLAGTKGTNDAMGCCAASRMVLGRAAPSPGHQVLLELVDVPEHRARTRSQSRGDYMAITAIPVMPSPHEFWTKIVGIGVGGRAGVGAGVGAGTGNGAESIGTQSVLPLPPEGTRGTHALLRSLCTYTATHPEFVLPRHAGRAFVARMKLVLALVEEDSYVDNCVDNCVDSAQSSDDADTDTYASPTHFDDDVFQLLVSCRAFTHPVLDSVLTRTLWATWALWARRRAFEMTAVPTGVLRPGTRRGVVDACNAVLGHPQVPQGDKVQVLHILCTRFMVGTTVDLVPEMAAVLCVVLAREPHTPAWRVALCESMRVVGSRLRFFGDEAMQPIQVLDPAWRLLLRWCCADAGADVISNSAAAGTKAKTATEPETASGSSPPSLVTTHPVAAFLEMVQHDGWFGIGVWFARDLMARWDAHQPAPRATSEVLMAIANVMHQQDGGMGLVNANCVQI